jgi:hypothetical protein
MSYLGRRIITILINHQNECLVILENTIQPRWIKKEMLTRTNNVSYNENKI